MPVSPDQLMRTFLPLTCAAIERARAEKVRFVHYTSAETATHLLRSKTMWMRNARLMNDFSEIQHGIHCHDETLNGPTGDELFKLLDEVHQGMSGAVLGWFNHFKPQIAQGTFVACVSEHSDTEDEIGRLSMWRAYGGSAGIALVFNTDALLSSRAQLGAFSGPVFYGGSGQIEATIRMVIDLVREQREQLSENHPDELVRVLRYMILVGCLYSKHSGFQEEREWRIISCPSLIQPKNLVPAVEIIGGVPQPVLKIPLTDNDSVSGLSIRQILNRIIVGPCINPWLVREAFSMTLSEHDGDGEPSKTSICCSEIPLRIP